MKKKVNWFCIFAAVATCARISADDLPPEILTQARVIRAMADQLKRLPDYTCIENLDRYRGDPKHVTPFDRVRVSVAIVGGHELYSFPGAAAFGDHSLIEMLSGGFISDGDFATMALNIFVQRTAEVIYRGEENVQGKATLRYDFHIAENRSGWMLQAGGQTARLSSSGTYWADANSFDIVRMNFAAEQMPPWSPDKNLEESVQYARVLIGESSILLPVTVDIRAEAFNGESLWNHISFSGCRQYSSASVISFGDDQAALSATASERPKRTSSLPAGLDIDIRLDAPILSKDAFVGGQIRGTVAKDVRLDGETLIPRGATATGFIRTMERHQSNAPYYSVGISFDRIETDGRLWTVSAKLQGMSYFAGLHRDAVSFVDTVDSAPRVLPGVGSFYVTGESIRIPARMTTKWRTL